MKRSYCFTAAWMYVRRFHVFVCRYPRIYDGRPPLRVFHRENFLCNRLTNWSIDSFPCTASHQYIIRAHHRPCSYLYVYNNILMLCTSHLFTAQRTTFIFYTLLVSGVDGWNWFSTQPHTLLKKIRYEYIYTQARCVVWRSC